MGAKPILVFINTKSGPQKGWKLRKKFLRLLNPLQVHLSEPVRTCDVIPFPSCAVPAFTPRFRRLSRMLTQSPKVCCRLRHYIAHPCQHSIPGSSPSVGPDEACSRQGGGASARASRASAGAVLGRPRHSPAGRRRRWYGRLDFIVSGPYRPAEGRGRCDRMAAAADRHTAPRHRYMTGS